MLTHHRSWFSSSIFSLFALVIALGALSGCSLFAATDEAADHRPARASTRDGDGTEPSCGNYRRDGDETDVDCGGGTCPPCDDGEACVGDSDCESGLCTEGVCIPVFCGDGIVNGDEECDGDGAGQGGETDTCDVDCTIAVCGDGVRNEAAGEECDDGDADVADDCPDGPGGTCQAASCSDGFLHNRGSGEEIGVDCGGSTCLACPGDLTLSEIAAAGLGGEYVEIHNPGGSEVDLSYVFVADFDTYYLVGNGTADPGDDGFLVKFPAGSSIGAGETIVIATQSATEFESHHGWLPDYDLDDTDTGAPALIGVVGGDAALDDASGVVVLFVWDGSSSLVQDLDIVLYGDRAHAVDKTGVSVGSGVYAPDTPAAEQSVLSAAGAEQSLSRCDANEGAEPANGGNGYLGHDETGENLTESWRLTRYATPGRANVCVLQGERYGGEAFDIFDEVVSSGSGHLVVGGLSNSATLNLGCGPMAQAGARDAVVAKLTTDGESCVWSARSSGTAGTTVTALAVDGAGDVIVGGWFTGELTFGGTSVTSVAGADMFVAKLAGIDGAQQWITAGHGPGWNALTSLAAATDGTGDVFVVGSASGAEFSFGTTVTNPYPGSRQVVVARLASATGDEVWCTMFPGGGVGANQARAVAADGAGDLVITGYFEAPTISFGGDDLVGTGDRDAFAVKLAGSDGGHVWSSSAAGGAMDFGDAIAVDALGNVLITGRFESDTFDWGVPLTNSDAGGGEGDTFVTKLGGQSGAHLWTIGSNSPGLDQGNALAVLPGGDVLVGGSFEGAVYSLGAGGEVMTNTGGSDAVVVRLRAADGANVFSIATRGQTSGTGSDESIWDLAVAPDGTALAAGQIQAEQVSVDAELTLTNASVDEQDGFWLRFR